MKKCIQNRNSKYVRMLTIAFVLIIFGVLNLFLLEKQIMADLNNHFQHMLNSFNYYLTYKYDALHIYIQHLFGWLRVLGYILYGLLLICAEIYQLIFFSSIYAIIPLVAFIFISIIRKEVLKK